MSSERTFTVTAYNPANSAEWDNFVCESRNATFLLRRNYMDYHADRFDDASLMIRETRHNRLVALFAACRAGDIVCAHAGLTYGGIVLPMSGIDGSDVLAIMQEIADYYRLAGFNALRYKAIPYIYHRAPSDDDIYALFRLGAKLDECDLSSAVNIAAPTSFNENSRRNLQRAVANGITVKTSTDYDAFWAILQKLLDEKYGTTPVHTSDEIKMLAARFPENIRLLCAYEPTSGTNSEMIGGAVFYITETCVHAQYIATSGRGRETGALAALFHHAITDMCTGKRYLDFGTSNENHGMYLNAGLLRQKYGMGGRGVAYCTYTIDL